MNRSLFEFEEKNEVPNIYDLRFPSGGARYVLYIGVYAALEKAGMMQAIKKVTGTSAGALISLPIGLNVSSTDLYHDLRKRDLSEADANNLLGERIGSFTDTNPIGVTAITRSGEPLLANIKKITFDTIKKFLESEKVSLSKYNDDLQESLSEYNKFLNELRKRFNQDDPAFTFEDLKQLREIFPDEFKDVSFEAATLPDAQPCILNVHTKPNVDISKACYASAAIQGVCAPIKLEDDNQLEYIDGGVHRYICTGSVGENTDPTVPNPDPKNTLLIVCTDHLFVPENSSSYKALHGDKDQTEIFDPTFPERFYNDTVLPYFVGIPPNQRQANWNANYQEISKNYRANTIAIDSCGILPMQFGRAKQLERQLYASSFLDTMNYLTDRQMGMSNQDADYMYKEIFTNFKFIYDAILQGSLSKPVFTDYMKYKGKASSAKEVCALIHKGLKQDIESPEALALTYAVEFYNNVITAEQLFNDVYLTAFKQTGFTAVSNILDERIFSSNTLKTKLQTFSIFEKSKHITDGGRADIVMKQLGQIMKFQKAREEFNIKVRTI